jgi:hypothetical protein
LYKLNKYKFKLAQLEKSGKKDVVKRNIYLMKLKKYSNVLVGGAQCHEGVSNCPCRGCTCESQQLEHNFTPGINTYGDTIHCVYKSCQCECMCSFAHINLGKFAPLHKEDDYNYEPAPSPDLVVPEANAYMGNWDDQYAMSE